MSSRHPLALPVVLTVAAALYLVAVGRPVAGLSLDEYPVKFPDSFDWLANALRLTGVPLDVTWRAPLIPFLQAACLQTGHADWIPYFGRVALLATVGILAVLGRRLLGPAGLYAAGLYAVSHQVVTHAFVIGSDISVNVFTTTAVLATALALKEEHAPWLYLAVGALALGFLTQPSTPLLLPPLFTLLLADGGRRWRALARRHVWPLLALGTAIVLAADVLRWRLTGEFHPRTLNRPVAWPAGHLQLYLWSSVAAWSIPVTGAMVVGIAATLRDAARRPMGLGLAVAVATQVLFFGLVYDWRDPRFVLHWTPFALLLAGAGIATLPTGFAVPVALACGVASNLTAAIDTATNDPLAGPPAIVLRLGRAYLMEIETGTLQKAGTPVQPLQTAFFNWVAARRQETTGLGTDDIYFAPARFAVARAAANHVPLAETLYVQPAAAYFPVHSYILRNQVALLAHRATALWERDSEPLGPGAILMLPSVDADRGNIPAAQGRPISTLERQPPWSLVRVE